MSCFAFGLVELKTHAAGADEHADGLRGRENVMYGTLPNGRRVTGEQQDEGRREAARILRGTP